MIFLLLLRYDLLIAIQNKGQKGKPPAKKKEDNKEEKREIRITGPTPPPVPEPMQYP